MNEAQSKLFEVISANFTPVNDQAQYLFEEAFQDVVNSFGGCLICYGKGWSSYLESTRVVSPGNGEKDSISHSKAKIKYCNCSRGKQLQELFEDK